MKNVVFQFRGTDLYDVIAELSWANAEAYALQLAEILDGKSEEEVQGFFNTLEFVLIDELPVRESYEEEGANLYISPEVDFPAFAKALKAYSKLTGVRTKYRTTTRDVWIFRKLEQRY